MRLNLQHLGSARVCILCNSCLTGFAFCPKAYMCQDADHNQLHKTRLSIEESLDHQAVPDKATVRLMLHNISWAWQPMPELGDSMRSC